MLCFRRKRIVAAGKLASRLLIEIGVERCRRKDFKFDRSGCMSCGNARSSAIHSQTFPTSWPIPPDTIAGGQFVDSDGISWA